ncbi:MAG TPA: DUF4301 family protein [Candidatus Binatia bacterium]|nr:DUF4301 family protein [Candidatus Binatia bacterium]
MTVAEVFDAADRARIEAHGLTVAEAARQLGLFAAPPGPTVLDRPCTVGDGIRLLTDAEAATCVAAHEPLARAGRLTKFVPASGAASRMFKALLWAREHPEASTRRAAARLAAEGHAEARELLAFAEGLPRLGFYPDLAAALAAAGKDAAALAARGELGDILATLLAAEGLDYAARPKALIPFHRYPEGSRTPFEEHLVEAAGYVRDERGVCRLHFTVSSQHRAAFEGLLERVRERYERRLAARFEVGFSVQKPSTDTLAADAGNRPFRTADGALLFRPGGHGALLANLADLGADVVCIKNIDNVVPERLLGPTVHWKKALIGLLATVQARAFELLRALAAGPDPAVEAALAFLEHELLVVVPAAVRAGNAAVRRAFAIDRLDRPLRVCGMVRNRGEPGGGPFWVRGPDGGTSLQIVETAQVDVGSPGQRAILAAATHFNPVDLVCGLRDWRGRPFDLARFVDPDAVFLAEKSHEGRVLKALEHPGLWNGGMAGWNTVFVEVPAITLNPVKTVNDLLRPEHQPA